MARLLAARPQREPRPSRPVLTTRACRARLRGLLRAQVAWLKQIGIEDVGYLLVRHPNVLSHSLDNLQAKHAFVTQVWGRAAKEVEIFPQCLTYSLHYLRARAGFLQVHGKDKMHLHRALRTPDQLFATKLAGGTTASYQAFAAAVKLGSGDEAFDAHARSMSKPGGGGGAFDWGETSLEGMLEELGTPALRGRGMLHAELTRVEKHMAFTTEQLARDRQLETDLLATRASVAHFLVAGPGGMAEAEVTPVDSATTAEAAVASTEQSPAAADADAARGADGVDAAAAPQEEPSKGPP
jgi:hypothetical protein